MPREPFQDLISTQQSNLQLPTVAEIDASGCSRSVGSLGVSLVVVGAASKPVLNLRYKSKLAGAAGVSSGRVGLLRLEESERC